MYEVFELTHMSECYFSAGKLSPCDFTSANPRAMQGCVQRWDAGFLLQMEWHPLAANRDQCGLKNDRGLLFLLSSIPGKDLKVRRALQETSWERMYSHSQINALSGTLDHKRRDRFIPRRQVCRLCLKWMNKYIQLIFCTENCNVKNTSEVVVVGTICKLHLPCLTADGELCCMRNYGTSLCANHPTLREFVLVYL